MPKSKKRGTDEPWPEPLDVPGIQKVGPGWVTCVVSGCDEYADKNGRYCFEHNRKWGTYRRRGFSQEKFEDLIAQNVCACCGKEYHILWLDHDHLHHPENAACPECARGMVCPRCNQWLAALDQPGWLEKAKFYLWEYEQRAPR